MIYHLLHEHFNLVRYISFRATGAAITALLICFLIGPRIIRTLVKHHYGETVRKTGPKSHLKKEGTPSMGGIIIILSIVLPTILWAKINNPFSSLPSCYYGSRCNIFVFIKWIFFKNELILFYWSR